MLILECSQGCYGRTDGRKEGQTDGSVTISLRNFVGEGIINIGKKNTCVSATTLALILSAYIKVFIVIFEQALLKTNLDEKVRFIVRRSFSP
jgi:hypothetical protein